MNEIDPINYLFVMAEYIEEKYIKTAESNYSLVVTAGKKKPSGIATKTNPGLWSRCKSEAKSRMGGKHSARAMQLAVKLYKQRGGGFKGGKPSAKTNKMKKWTKQKWMYLKDYKKKDKNKLDDNLLNEFDYESIDSEKDLKSLEELEMLAATNYAKEYETTHSEEDISYAEDNPGRYLPEAKWRSLSQKEREATDRKKKREGKNKQYVDNTEKAKVKSKHKYY